jgi:hypothetical protein
MYVLLLTFMFVGGGKDPNKSSKLSQFTAELYYLASSNLGGSSYDVGYDGPYKLIINITFCRIERQSLHNRQA